MKKIHFTDEREGRRWVFSTVCGRGITHESVVTREAADATCGTCAKMVQAQIKGGYRHENGTRRAIGA